jgi:hypothetical protein
MHRAVAVSGFDLFELHFPHVKKHWQASEAALDPQERDQNDRGSYNVHSEKSADSIGKQFADEEQKIQSVLH